MTPLKNKPAAHKALGFPTQKAAVAMFRDMLRGVTALDAAMLRRLVELHPRAAEKIGPGIDHIYVAGAAYGSRCFHICRTDGSRVDFSYMKALRGLKNNEAAQ